MNHGDAEARRGRRGFTLTEMLVVVAILVILSAIAVAALVRTMGTAREAGTRALIEKVNRGLQERLQSVSGRTVPLQACDRLLARDSTGAVDEARAQVIAKKRLLKEEFPQWFEVVPDSGSPGGFVLVGDWDPLWVGGTNIQSPGEVSAVALGYANWVRTMATRDMDDNDGDGPIDADDPDEWLLSYRDHLSNHDPATTSAECLYMILTRGPGSSQVDPTEFSHSQVEDSDGDGLPEFTDGFGQPIRFYRSAFFYESALQKGIGAYDNTSSVLETREEDPLDPNRLLMRAGWWNAGRDPQDLRNGNNLERAYSFPFNAAGLQAQVLPRAFPSVTDIYAVLPAGRRWAWNGPAGPALPFNPAYGEWARAYRGAPLIVSAGPDERFGIYTPGLGVPPVPPSPFGMDAAIRSGALSLTTAFWTTLLNSDAQHKEEVEAYRDNISNHNQ